MNFKSFEFYAILIHYIAERNYGELLTQEDRKYKFFLENSAKKRVCLGAMGNFSGIEKSDSMIVVKQSLIEVYPKITHFSEASFFSSFFSNCTKLAKFGLKNEGLFSLVSFFVFAMAHLESEECKSLFLYISILKLLSLVGFLDEQGSIYSEKFFLLFNFNRNELKANLSRGFTKEAFNERIILKKILLSTSDEFNLNLIII